MTVRFMRKATVASSDAALVGAWIEEYTRFLDSRAPEGGRVQAWSEMFGEYGLVYWTLDCGDVAAVDAWLASLNESEEYRGILIRGADLFLSGGTKDTLFKERG